MKNYKLLYLFLLMLPVIAKAQDETPPSTEILRLKYYSSNNSLQYLLTETLLKTGRQFTPLANKQVQLYLDSIAPANLIARITTDTNGKAKSFIPPGLKAAWEAGSKHTFFATAEGKEEPIETEIEIIKAKIEIDTLSDGGDRNIIVHVLKLENNEWMPAAETELRVGIKRMSSLLNAGEDEFYTTDEEGKATVTFNKNNLPGDKKGNLVLVAKAEDNDDFGNLLIEKTVPWGTVVQPGKNFFEQRTLWSTRFKTPYWLLFMAYSIVIAVWGTILYLVTRIIKIYRIGKSPS